MKSKNPTGGYFLVTEGPSGAGKSTLVKLLERRLTDYGIKVLAAKEPHSSEDHLCGLDLLNRIVYDRRNYLHEVILPALTADIVVIMDRYIPSSLVYQRIDGLGVEEIWKLNKDFLKPSMTVFLHAQRDLLDDRIAERSVLTRFENAGYRDREIKFYKQVHDLVVVQSWQTIEINTSMTPEEIVNVVLNNIFTSLLILPSV